MVKNPPMQRHNGFNLFWGRGRPSGGGHGSPPTLPGESPQTEELGKGYIHEGKELDMTMGYVTHKIELTPKFVQ